MDNFGKLEKIGEILAKDSLVAIQKSIHTLHHRVTKQLDPLVEEDSDCSEYSVESN